MNAGLAELLTPTQKAAILTALKWIGLWVSMDISELEELQPLGDRRLEKTCDLLQIHKTNRLVKMFEDSDEQKVFDTLASLPQIAKPWFIVETYMMVSSEGDITERAMLATLHYCQRMGVGEKEYVEIVKSAYIESGEYREGMFDM